MRYVSAYTLLALTGKEPLCSDLERVLQTVGIEVDLKKIQQVCKELKNKSIEDVITLGRGKLAAMPVGGGAAVAAAAGAPAAAAAPAAEKKEEKKVEKEDSESDDDMGFGLFD